MDDVGMLKAELERTKEDLGRAREYLIKAGRIIAADATMLARPGTIEWGAIRDQETWLLQRVSAW